MENWIVKRCVWITLVVCLHVVDFREKGGAAGHPYIFEALILSLMVFLSYLCDYCPYTRNLRNSVIVSEMFARRSITVSDGSLALRAYFANWHDHLVANSKSIFHATSAHVAYTVHHPSIHILFGRARYSPEADFIVRGKIKNLLRTYSHSCSNVEHFQALGN